MVSVKVRNLSKHFWRAQTDAGLAEYSRSSCSYVLNPDSQSLCFGTLLSSSEPGTGLGVWPSPVSEHDVERADRFPVEALVGVTVRIQ